MICKNNVKNDSTGRSSESTKNGACPAINARFSAASETYHKHACVQKKVANRLLSIMPNDFQGGQVLDIGCGTGVLTELVLKQLPKAQIDALDVSPKMIENANSRLGGESRVRWIQGDLRNFRSSIKYPIIVSSSAMHWIAPIYEALKCVQGLLCVGGTFVAAVMVKGTLHELRKVRLRVAPHKPALAQLPSSDEVLSSLDQTGLGNVCFFQETICQQYDSASNLLRVLHDQGVTGGEVSASSTFLTRGELDRLVAAYEAEYKNPQGVVASYEVLYLKAEQIRR